MLLSHALVVRKKRFHAAKISICINEDTTEMVEVAIESVEAKRKNRGGVCKTVVLRLEEPKSSGGRVLPLCMIKMKEEADQANTYPYGG